jgi:hypothetical protein
MKAGSAFQSLFAESLYPSRARAAAAQLKLAKFLNIESIVSMLSGSCHRGKQEHQCLKQFEGHANSIRNWRSLWKSTPRELRHDQLLSFFRAQQGSKTQFAFLGLPLCESAFKILTGIGDSLLQATRKLVAKGASSATTLVGRQALIANTSKPKKYLDCRQWLESLARTHGEQNPSNGLVVLPSGRRSFYHSAYVFERTQPGVSLDHLDGAPAELGTFLSCWRQELPYLVLSTGQGFIKCGTCEYLRNLMQSTPRSMQELISAARLRLGQHYSFQSSQRLALAALEECADKSGKQIWFDSKVSC